MLQKTTHPAGGKLRTRAACSTDATTPVSVIFLAKVYGKGHANSVVLVMVFRFGGGADEASAVVRASSGIWGVMTLLS